MMYNVMNVVVGSRRSSSTRTLQESVSAPRFQSRQCSLYHTPGLKYIPILYIRYTSPIMFLKIWSTDAPVIASLDTFKFEMEGWAVYDLDHQRICLRIPFSTVRAFTFLLAETLSAVILANRIARATNQSVGPSSAVGFSAVTPQKVSRSDFSISMLITRLRPTKHYLWKLFRGGGRERERERQNKNCNHYRSDPQYLKKKIIKKNFG